MSTSLKKEYNKRLFRVALNFNTEERALLEKMRLADEWENIAGFIKYKLFGESTETNYKKMLRSRTKDDTYLVMKSLLDSLNRSLEYLHYKMNFEAEKFKKEHTNYEKNLAKKAAAALEDYNRKTGTDVKFNIEDLANTIIKLDKTESNKQIALMKNWIDGIKKRTDEIFRDCQVILRSIDISIEKEKLDRMSLLSDEELEPFGKDWDNTTSPEALEKSRREIKTWEKKNNRKIDG